MPLLTVFTPTYNRKKTLKRTYESLVRQTSKDFLWLIIDDGSTDDTKSAVEEWQNRDNGFEIRYCYKENGGLHTGYNKAIELADTELMVCIDSDDYMPDNAVERICEVWRKKGSEKYGGIIGLDYTEDDEVIGNMLPDTEDIDLVEVSIGKIDVHGDKKQVVRTDLFKEVAPMPVYKGEKNFNPYYLIMKVALKHKFIVMNENLCYVDYQNDGMTANQIKQYYNSPNSFAELRQSSLSLPGAPLKLQIRQAIHFVSSCILAKRNWYEETPKKLLTLAVSPLGWVLSKYIRYKLK